MIMSYTTLEVWKSKSLLKGHALYLVQHNDNYTTNCKAIICNKGNFNLTEKEVPEEIKSFLEDAAFEHESSIVIDKERLQLLLDTI